MRTIFLLLLLMLSSGAAFAQTPKDSLQQDDPLNQQIELLSENLEQEDADYTNLVEALQYYKDHPINLNTATREELIDFPLLSSVQVDNLLRHRERFGNLISIYELQAVDGFDLGTIYKILPYIKVSDRFDAGHFDRKEMFKNGKHEVVMRGQRVLESQKGFSPIDSAELAASPNSRYLGDPYRLFLRYRFTYSNFISWGLVAEKDAGEQFFKGAQKNGFDYYSAHFCVRNIGVVKAAVVGDYQVSFGQGLVAWTGFAFGKTSFTVNTKRNAIGIRPYSSVDENRFMRGAATTLRFGKIETTAFYSVKKRDANISASDTTASDIEVLEVSSLQTSGLHSTPAEIADKDAITEQLMGGNVSWKGKFFRAGVTGAYSHYSAPLKRSLGLYNQFDFSAQQNTVVGADYDWSLKNFHFFGEGARSENGGLAFVNGVLISLDPRLALTVHHRWFDKNFQNLYANTFSEGTFPQNERGIYMGIQAKAHRKVTISAYIDKIVYPWMRYQTDAPSDATDFLVQINFTPDKKTDMYFRFRHRESFRNANDYDASIDYLTGLTRNSYRFNITYMLGPNIRLRNRIEYLEYAPGNEKQQNGFVMWQDVTFKKLGSPVSISARYALFQTEGYDARIYAYENDMPYAFSVPAYYYKGSRVYMLINWDITRKFELWFRIGRFIYSDRNIISEGSLTEINGNTKTEAKLQIRMKF